jgi:hypothetical protein
MIDAVDAAPTEAQMKYLAEIKAQYKAAGGQISNPMW